MVVVVGALMGGWLADGSADLLARFRSRLACLPSCRVYVCELFWLG